MHLGCNNLHILYSGPYITILHETLFILARQPSAFLCILSIIYECYKAALKFPSEYRNVGYKALKKLLIASGMDTDPHALTHFMDRNNFKPILWFKSHILHVDSTRYIFVLLQQTKVTSWG